MSGSVGTDASNYVAYYFTCTAGGGHDSGWIASNHYTDVGLTPSTQYTYTVKMQDKYGNTGTASSALAATTQTSSAGTASFAYGPVGISDTAAMMTATKVANASGLTEYKFTRNDAVTSGWQASPTWTNTGLTRATATLTPSRSGTAEAIRARCLRRRRDSQRHGRSHTAASLRRITVADAALRHHRQLRFHDGDDADHFGRDRRAVLLPLHGGRSARQRVAGQPNLQDYRALPMEPIPISIRSGTSRLSSMSPDTPLPTARRSRPLPAITPAHSRSWRLCRTITW